jgi:hypothetical protein
VETIEAGYIFLTREHIKTRKFIEKIQSIGGIDIEVTHKNKEYMDNIGKMVDLSSESISYYGMLFQCQKNSSWKGIPKSGNKSFMNLLLLMENNSSWSICSS